jgi:MFS family permease
VSRRPTPLLAACEVLALAGVVRAVGLGALLFAVTEFRDNSLLWLAPGLFINGLGTGFAVAPLAANVLARISPQHVGAASGVLTTGIQVGNAIGVAIIGIIFYGVLATASDSQAFAFSLVYLTAVSLVLCCIIQLLPPQRGATSA